MTLLGTASWVFLRSNKKESLVWRTRPFIHTNCQIFVTFGVGVTYIFLQGSVSFVNMAQRHCICLMGENYIKCTRVP